MRKILISTACVALVAAIVAISQHSSSPSQKTEQGITLEVKSTTAFR